MGWKIVDIEINSKLKLFLNNLLIFKNEKRLSIPLEDIDTIMIDNQQTLISSQLIIELSKKNILTILCDNKHLPCSLILPISGNYNSLKIFNDQLTWDSHFKSFLWKKIVKNKIQNQINLLNFLCLKFDQNLLTKLSNSVQEFDITNREGHAAKLYWHALFGMNFNRENENKINLLLNYGYSLLYSYFSRSIVKKGLDPRISLFHKSFSNHFALASDLMEEFRPLIDSSVYQMINCKKNIFIYEAKQILLNIFNQKCLVNQNEYYISNAIDLYIDNILNKKDIVEITLIFQKYEF